MGVFRYFGKISSLPFTSISRVILSPNLFITATTPTPKGSCKAGKKNGAPEL